MTSKPIFDWTINLGAVTAHNAHVGYRIAF